MHVFVARVRFFALLDEHFLLSFLTNVGFLCIIGMKDTKKGECKCTVKLFGLLCGRK